MAGNYMPIGISMKDRRCLVVGGGVVALRKIDNLLEYDARVTVVAPETVNKIEYYASRGLIALDKRAYRSGEVSEYGIVISASDDQAVNKAVHDDCRQAGVPVNVVDNPTLCDFIFPAVVRRDCLTLAISTDGRAPFMSSHLRFILETIFPDHWKKLMRMAADFRKGVLKRYPEDHTKRVDAFERFVNADWKTLIKEKDEDALAEELRRLLEGQP